MSFCLWVVKLSVIFSGFFIHFLFLFFKWASIAQKNTSIYINAWWLGPYCKIKGNSKAWLYSWIFHECDINWLKQSTPPPSHSLPSETTIGNRILSQNQNDNYSLFKGRCGSRWHGLIMRLFILDNKHTCRWNGPPTSSLSRSYFLMALYNKHKVNHSQTCLR